MNTPATIAKVGDIIADYGRNGSNYSPEQVMDSLRVLTGYLYFLATVTEDERAAMDAAYFRHRADGKSA